MIELSDLDDSLFNIGPPSPMYIPPYRRVALSHHRHTSPASNPSGKRRLLPRLWEVMSTSSLGPSASSRKRLPSSQSTLWPIDYDSGDWLPLDGEEGELVEDEGFLDSVVDPPADHGIPYPSHSTALPPKKLDIISHLPPELALHIFCYILDLPALAAISRVSRYWNILGGDMQVWRELFVRNEDWVINPTRATQSLKHQLKHRLRMDSHSSAVTSRSAFTSPAVLYSRWGRNSLLSLRSLNQSHRKLAMDQAVALASGGPLPYSDAPPLSIDWKSLFKSRFEIDRRWSTADWEPRSTYFKGHVDR